MRPRHIAAIAIYLAVLAILGMALVHTVSGVLVYEAI